MNNLKEPFNMAVILAAIWMVIVPLVANFLTYYFYPGHVMGANNVTYICVGIMLDVLYLGMLVIVSWFLFRD